MPESRGCDDANTLSDALRIAERAFRIADITGEDPFAAVVLAAEYLQLKDTQPQDWVLEKLSDAGTAVDWEIGLQMGLLEIIAELKRRLGRN